MSVTVYIPPPADPLVHQAAEEPEAPEEEGMSMESMSMEGMEEFDPGEHTVDEVKEYISEHPDQIEDVLVAEESGKNRSTLVTWLEEQESPPEEGT